MIPINIKMYFYAFILAGIAAGGLYIFYLQTSIEVLEQDNQILQSTVDFKDAQMKQAIEDLAAARQTLQVVTEKSEQLTALAEKRKADVNWLQKKLNNLGSKIATSTTPETFEGEVSSEFVNVISCLEAASGNVNAVCAVSQAEVETNDDKG